MDLRNPTNSNGVSGGGYPPLQACGVDVGGGVGSSHFGRTGEAAGGGGGVPSLSSISSIAAPVSVSSTSPPTRYRESPNSPTRKTFSEANRPSKGTPQSQERFRGGSAVPYGRSSSAGLRAGAMPPGREEDLLGGNVPKASVRGEREDDAFGARVLMPRHPLERPSAALSSHIMVVYKEINLKFCNERRRSLLGTKPNEGYDDREGHYISIIGEEIAGRYTVQELLGKGSFGIVLRCCDEKYQEPVALKIIRSGAYFRAQGCLEAEIVAYLNKNPALANLVVQLRKAFIWQGHIVLVLDLLSFNLYQLIRCTKFNGMSLDLTRKFAFQLLQVLLQLELHDPPIIHCDLKPENVVLRDRNRSGIRVIDFGSSCYQQTRHWVLPPPRVAYRPRQGGEQRGEGSVSAEPALFGPAAAYGPAEGRGKVGKSGDGEEGEGGSGGGPYPIAAMPLDGNTVGDLANTNYIMPKYIQSRFYRSPEVILELGYTTAIDRWSLGCMLVELHTGIPLFPGKNEADMLALFTAILGPLPDAMLASSPKVGNFYSYTPPEEAAVVAEGERRDDNKNNNNNNNGAWPSSHTDSLANMMASLTIASTATKTTIITNRAKEATAEGAAGRPPRRSTRNSATPTAPSRSPRNHPPWANKPLSKGSNKDGIGKEAAGKSGTGSVKGGSGAATAPEHPLRVPSGVDAATMTTGGAEAQLLSPNATATAATTTSASAGAAAMPQPPSVFKLMQKPDPQWCRPLEDIIGIYTGGPRGCRRGQPGHEPFAYKIFLDFIKRLLEYDPRKRMNCAEAIRHPFLAPLIEMEAKAAAAAALQQQQQQQQQ